MKRREWPCHARHAVTRAASAPESSRTGSGSAKGGWFGRAKEKVKRWKNRTPVQHEANKAAQKRYRERKKGQVTELQAQAEQLAAQAPHPACLPLAHPCMGRFLPPQNVKLASAWKAERTRLLSSMAAPCMPRMPMQCCGQVFSARAVHVHGCMRRLFKSSLWWHLRRFRRCRWCRKRTRA